MSIRARLRSLETAQTASARRFRTGLFILDAALVAFFVITTFTEHTRTIIVIDYFLGGFLALELVIRAWLAKDWIEYFCRPLTWIEVAVAVSLFAPSLTENLIFLRIMRSFRIFRSYTIISDLRARSKFFRRNELVVFSATNLMVFVFVVSAAVYALQVRVNAQINNYMDALYFTVTTLTTTGFGDIVLVGEYGRMLSVVIMFVGVSLFLRLIQTVFRPPRVNYECPACGLTRHEPDAVHCKHCGGLLHIVTEGDY